MTAARHQRLLAVVLVAFVAASAFSTFPHLHADKPGAALEAENSPSSHTPRPGECLEHTDNAPGPECAICFFQRIASHGQFGDVPTLDAPLPDRGVASSTQAIFVARSTCLSDPRGPPTL
jgi:hypothetical protein